jgi:hypothetical protein
LVFVIRLHRQALAADGVIRILGAERLARPCLQSDMQAQFVLARHVPVLIVDLHGALTGDDCPGGRSPLHAVFPGRDSERPLVLTPVMGSSRHGSAWLLAPQVRLAAMCLGLRHPLLWVDASTDPRLVEALPRAGLLLQAQTSAEAIATPADCAAVGARIVRAADLVDGWPANDPPGPDRHDDIFGRLAAAGVILMRRGRQGRDFVPRPA